MTDEEYLEKKGYFEFECIDDEDEDYIKLADLKSRDQDIEDVKLRLRDCTGLYEFLEIFQSIKKLDLAILDNTEDIKSEVQVPNLRSVQFATPIPMNFKNLWNTFVNLEEVSIGKLYGLFSSEFVNQVILRNENSLKALRLLDVPLIAATYSPLIVPCQLEELEILYLRETSKKLICHHQDRAKDRYEEQEINKQPGVVFYTKPEEITSFDNLTEILRSQTELKTLILDYAIVESELLDILASKLYLRNLKIKSSELRLDEINHSSKEFFRNIKKLVISHVLNNTEYGLREILSSLKDIEVLEISCIWISETSSFKTIENRIFLLNLKELKMVMNDASNEILDSFEFSDSLERVTAEIGSVERVEEIFRTSPNIKYFNIEAGEDVANFIVTRFKKLECFEWPQSDFSLQTILFILENASHIKRVKIYLKTDLSKENEQILNERLQTEFPGFYNDNGGRALEIHNKELDFKLRIGQYYNMLCGSW